MNDPIAHEIRQYLEEHFTHVIDLARPTDDYYVFAVYRPWGGVSQLTVHRTSFRFTGVREYFERYKIFDHLATGSIHIAKPEMS